MMYVCVAAGRNSRSAVPATSNQLKDNAMLRMYSLMLALTLSLTG